MNAAHVRPMSAYIGLCAAGVFVLAQSLSSAPLTGPAGIARAGEPAFLVTEAITLSVVQGLTDLGADVVTSIVPGASDAVVGQSADTGATSAGTQRRTPSGAAGRGTVRRSTQLTVATPAPATRRAPAQAAGGGKHRAAAPQRGAASGGDTAARTPAARKR